MTSMTDARQSGFSLTENGWRALLLSTTVIILVFTVYCLSQGITIIFMHLYYFPIILLAYHYHKKGVILSAVLGVLYVVLVIVFTYPAMADIYGAGARFVVFVGIAAVVAYLSETLEKRERECSTIIANSEDGIIIVDLSRRVITEVNRRGSDMLGYGTEELVNATLETIWQDTEERVRFSNLIKTGGRARTIEAHLTQKTGGSRTVLLSAGVLPEYRVVLTVTDITDREYMLNEMRRLSEVRESIISNANVWLMVLDSHGRILEWNRAAEEMSGYPATGVIGGNEVWKRLYPEKNYRAEITGKITEIIKKDTYLENLQTIIVCRDGTQKTILWNTRGLPDIKGVTGHYIAIGVDITDREKVEQVSREYAEWYSTILRTTQDGYNLVDASGRLIEVNDNYCRMTGFSREELLGRSISDQDADESKDIASAHLQKILKTGSDRFETRHRTNGGGAIDVEISVVLQVKKQQFIVFVRDITERKHAEKNLRESERRLTLAIEGSDIGIWDWNVPTGRIDYNDRQVIMLGDTPDEFGNDVNQFLNRIHKDDLPEFSAMLKDCINGTSSRFSHEIRFMHRDNTWVWVLARGSVAERDMNGKAARISGTHLDITERKRAEEKLLESEEKFHTIADFTADWEYWQGQDKQIIYMSPSCERFTGYTQQEFLADPNLLETIVHPDDLASVQDHNKVAWDTRRALSTDFRIIHRDGTIRWIGHACRQVYDNEGKALGRRVSNRDITDRNLLEIRLTESEGRLKEIIESMIAGVVIIDPETHTIIDVNSVAARMIGAEKDEIIGSVCHRYICPAEIGACPITDLEQTVDKSEKVLLTHHGEKIPILKSVTRIQINKRPYLLESFIDITDLKRAESAVRESEEKYHAFFTTSRDCVFMTSVDGRWIDFNNSAVELFGYESREELMPVKIADLYAHPEERNAHVRTISEQGFTKEYPVDLRKKDGTIINTLISSVARRDQKGSVIGFQGVIRDITELKRTEMELQELASVVRYSGELVGIATLDGKTTFLNDAGARMLGILPADAIGKDFIRFIPDHLKEKLRTEVLPASMEHGVWSGDFQYINQKSGNLIDVHAMAFTIADPATGKPQYLANVSLDITDRKRADDALHESEERYRTVIENASEAIVVAQDGLFKFANPKTMELLQSTPVNIIGRPFIDFIHPDDRELVFERYQRRVRGENIPVNYDFRFVGENGRIVWVIISAVRISWEGRPATLNFLIDITERKQAEEALHNSQQILRSVLNTISVRVFWKDRDLKYLGCNEPFAQDAGFHEPEELIGKDDYQMGWREQAELYRADDRLVIETGRPRILIEEPQTTPDGRTIWVLTSKTPLHNGSGGIIGVLGAYIDITERKRIEEALAQSEYRYRTLAESAQDVIFIINRDLRFTYMNSFGAVLAGKIPEEFVGMPLQALFPDETFERMSALLHEVFELGKPQHIEIEIPLPSSPQWHDTYVVPLADKDGNIFSVLGISRDITQRRQAEELRRHFTEELEQQVRSRTQELETSLNEKALLLREIHHRVRNNFQIIISLLSLQSRSIGEEKVAQAMQESQNRIRAMAFVHEKLYTSADLDRIDLEPYVNYLTTQLLNLYAVRPRTISLIVDVKNIFVDINTAIPLGLVINELVSNSLKHAFPDGRKGRITISIRDDDPKGLILTYEDNGVGFPEGFNWQETDSLGFRLIRGLIDQINGTIEHEPGKGTRFTIRVMKKSDEQGRHYGTFNPVPE